MNNKAMLRMLEKHECIDVAQIGELQEDGTYRLRAFVEDMDYCVKPTEEWIWSIGVDKSGNIFASRDKRFYQNPNFTCLWLR